MRISKKTSLVACLTAAAAVAALGASSMQAQAASANKDKTGTSQLKKALPDLDRKSVV